VLQIAQIHPSDRIYEPYAQRGGTQGWPTSSLSPCIDIKDKSCVDVCPVDCIHEFERILIIDPEECIDCERRPSSRRWRSR